MVQILNREIQKSVWVFIAEMDNDNPRFLFDIQNFAEKLKTKQDGDDSNFYFFVDNIDQMRSVLRDKNISTDRVFELSVFQDEISKLSNVPFLGCVISSHGNIDGAATLNPNKILSSINKIPGLTDGLLLLGQCFSGVFNVPSSSKICVIGASNFCESVSSGRIKNVPWVANIFLYYFSLWFIDEAAQDVDGDGICSILDAYKYASFKTSLLLQELKASYSKTFHLWCTAEVEKLYELSNQIIKPQENQNTYELQAMYETIQQQLNNNLSIYHNSQESWISDMNVALRLII